MEMYDNYDYDGCYVCGEYMGSFKNELQVNTAFSEKTVLEIIGKILIVLKFHTSS